MPTVFKTPQELLDASGADLGVTDWLEITQERINLFAEATGDQQWIHTNPEKAKDGPFQLAAELKARSDAASQTMQIDDKDSDKDSYKDSYKDSL